MPQNNGSNGNSPDRKPTFIAGQDSLPEGCMTTYRDLINIRKYDFPEIMVSDPVIKGSGPTKHVDYKVTG